MRYDGAPETFVREQPKAYRTRRRKRDWAMGKLRMAIVLVLAFAITLAGVGVTPAAVGTDSAKLRRAVDDERRLWVSDLKVGQPP